MIKPEILNSDDYIIIPNPVYDVIFKYLMEDKESAKIILSTLLNEKIIELEFKPLSHSETVKDPDSKQLVRLFHLDFIATIELSNGETEMVMIELQKSNKTSDIFRFKEYIMRNFQEKKKIDFFSKKENKITKIDYPIRLIPIFILNFRIENEVQDVIITSNHQKKAFFKDKILKESNEFIDHLTYNMMVIQLPYLSKLEPADYENDEHKKKVYALLKLFEQKNYADDKKHLLYTLKNEHPEFLRRIIKRLRSIQYPEIQSKMKVEDEYLAVLIRKSNEIAYFKQMVEKKEKELKENKKELEEKDKALKESRKVIYNLAKLLKNSGVANEEIQKQTNLSIEEIKNL